MIDLDAPGRPGDWSGGCYQLVIACSWSHDELASALGALAALPELEGYWRGRGAEALAAAPLPLDASLLCAAGELVGKLRIEGDGVTLVALRVRAGAGDRATALVLSLPLGSLDRAVQGGLADYPFGETLRFESLDESTPAVPSSLRWREPLDRLLAGLAEAVAAVVPVRDVRIGYEIDDGGS